MPLSYYTLEPGLRQRKIRFNGGRKIPYSHSVLQTPVCVSMLKGIGCSDDAAINFAKMTDLVASGKAEPEGTDSHFMGHKL